jgi:hypothetical protein
MTTNTQPHVPQPSAAMRQLDRLVGTWNLQGGVQGQVRYEWMQGGFFLLQHVDINHDGHITHGIEIIGHERTYGSDPSEDITSRYYGDAGDTLDYVYEIEGDTLTIWSGAKGSPAYFRGQFSADGNTLSGGWVWPGGGYQSTAVRIA